MSQKTPDYIKVKRLHVDTIKKNPSLVQRLINLSNGNMGSMKPWLDEALKGISHAYVIYAAIDKRTNDVVGWVFVTPSDADGWSIAGNKIGTFVDVSFRQQGIGTRLVRAVRRVTKDFACFTGTYQSSQFYKQAIPSNKITGHAHRRWSQAK